MRTIVLIVILTLACHAAPCQKVMKGWYLHKSTYTVYKTYKQVNIRFLKIGRKRFKLEELTGWYTIKDSLLILKGKSGVWRDTLVISTKPNPLKVTQWSEPGEEIEMVTYLYDPKESLDFTYYDKKKWAKLKAREEEAVAEPDQ